MRTLSSRARSKQEVAPAAARSEVADMQFKSNIAFAKETVQLEKAALRQATQRSTALEVARELNMPMEEVHVAEAEFFAMDVDGDGLISTGELSVALGSLLVRSHENVSKEQVKQFVEKSIEEIDTDNNQEIDFEEFIRWFATCRFSKELSVTAEERALMSLADAHDISYHDLEQVKRIFLIQDADASGMINQPEFENLLYKVLKVPPGVELPASRLRMYWQDIDIDKDGQVTFEEFVAWWVTNAKAIHPYEDFYRRFRPLALCSKYPRPWESEQGACQA